MTREPKTENYELLPLQAMTLPAVAAKESARVAMLNAMREECCTDTDPSRDKQQLKSSVMMLCAFGSRGFYGEWWRRGRGDAAVKWAGAKLARFEFSKSQYWRSCRVSESGRRISRSIEEYKGVAVPESPWKYTQTPSKSHLSNITFHAY